MSYYFTSDGRTLWNPALTVGQTYFGYVKTLESVFGVSPGFSGSSGDPDTTAVETAQFEIYLREMLRGWDKPEPHPILVALIRPVILSGIVMLMRAGVTTQVASESLVTPEELESVSRRMPI